MNAPRFFHFSAIFILFAWSGVMLYFFASGRVDAILTEDFRIGPLIGGLGLAVVGFFNLFTSKAKPACCHDHGHHDHSHDHEHHHHEEHGHDHDHKDGATCCGGHDHEGHDHEHHHEGHDHEHHSHDDDHSDHGHGHDHIHSHDDQTIPSVLATLVIVLVPAIGAASLSQDKFSIETLANKGLYSNEVVAPPSTGTRGGSDGSSDNDEDRYTLADLEKQVRKSEEGNFLIPIPSLFYSAADEELADVLEGLAIETTGQVAPEIAENDPEGNRLRLYRLFVSCCLADARPIGFSADFGKEPPRYTEDTWVKIIGKMAYPQKDGRRIPIIEVDRIETIPEPENPMY